MAEKILLDLAASDSRFACLALRYANVCGAHPNGGLGDKRKAGLSFLAQVLKAARNGEVLPDINKRACNKSVFKNEYLHVVDVCSAHYLALEALDKGSKSQILDLVLGQSHSDGEIVARIEAITEKKIGLDCKDFASNPSSGALTSQKAQSILGWSPRYSLEDMIKTAWVWENTLTQAPKPKSKFL
jgi:UDP-glucose 4-epimerase